LCCNSKTAPESPAKRSERTLGVQSASNQKVPRVVLTKKCQGRTPNPSVHVVDYMRPTGRKWMYQTDRSVGNSLQSRPHHPDEIVWQRGRKSVRSGCALNYSLGKPHCGKIPLSRGTPLRGKFQLLVASDHALSRSSVQKKKTS